MGKILNGQIGPTRLFGPAILKIQARFESKIKETEALGSLLPWKQDPKPQKSMFAQDVPMRPPSQKWRIPKKT